MSKPLREWSWQQVAGWLGGMKQLDGVNVRAIVEENEFDGGTLLELDKKDIAEAFEIKEFKAAKIMAEIKKKEQQTSVAPVAEGGNEGRQTTEPPAPVMTHARLIMVQSRANNAALASLRAQEKQTGVADSFSVNVSVNGKMVTLRQKMTVGSTVSHVAGAVKDQESISPEHLTYQGVLKLSTGGKLMHPEKTLGDYNIVNDKNLILVIFAVRGGMAQMPESERVREIDFSNKDVKASSKVCCIMQDDAEPRAEMPCGHAVSATALFHYVSLVAADIGAKAVFCPVPECGKKWNWELVTAVAGMSTEEYVSYTHLFERRNATDTRECPGCQNLTLRPDNLTHFRVACNGCKNRDWCFACGGWWTGRGMTICGSPLCPTDATKQALLHCETITPEYVEESNVQVPKLRACPNCLTLTEYEANCKHTQCQKCKTKFCLICLKQYNTDKGEWQCGDYTFVCDVAARQKLD